LTRSGWFDAKGGAGPPPLDTSFDVGAGEAIVIISFEATNGLPSTRSAQPFSLETTFRPR
jgi:hypothetical protein